MTKIAIKAQKIFTADFIESNGFQTLTWLRIIGGSVFTIGGVIPLTWFIASRITKLKK